MFLMKHKTMHQAIVQLCARFFGLILCGQGKNMGYIYLFLNYLMLFKWCFILKPILQNNVTIGTRFFLSLIWTGIGFFRRLLFIFLCQLFEKRNTIYNIILLTRQQKGDILLTDGGQILILAILLLCIGDDSHEFCRKAFPSLVHYTIAEMVTSLWEMIFFVFYSDVWMSLFFGG